MSNVGATMIKIAVVAGGAVAGALLARWSDQFMASHAQERSDFDKARYSQGLAPQQLPPQPAPQAPHPTSPEEGEI